MFNAVIRRVGAGLIGTVLMMSISVTGTHSTQRDNHEWGDYPSKEHDPNATDFTEQDLDVQELEALWAKAVGLSDYLEAEDAGLISARSRPIPNQNAWQEYQHKLRDYEIKYGLTEERYEVEGKATSVLGASIPEVSPSFVISKTLAVPWHQQINGYYCGPASAQSILDFLGYNKSKKGESLTQNNLAKYLNTTTSGTSSFNNSMPHGLNQWMTGKNTGLYTRTTVSTSAQLRTAAAYAIDRQRPWNVSAAEVGKNSSAARYNNHPKDREIYHWITGYGYGLNGGALGFVDSTAGRSGYGNSNKKFLTSSGHMIQFVKGRGLVR